MPISQTEGYLENPLYRVVEEPMLFLLALNWKLQKKEFSYGKDTHREKAPSNKTLALTKSRNMDIWVVGTSNQLFIRGS